MMSVWILNADKISALFLFDEQNHNHLTNSALQLQICSLCFKHLSNIFYMHRINNIVLCGTYDTVRHSTRADAQTKCSCLKHSKRLGTQIPYIYQPPADGRPSTFLVWRRSPMSPLAWSTDALMMREPSFVLIQREGCWGESAHNPCERQIDATVWCCAEAP